MKDPQLHPARGRGADLRDRRPRQRTTAGTLGVAFIGDKMTPLSETTILVPRLVGGGLTTGRHVRHMLWTAGPARGISRMTFLLMGLFERVLDILSGCIGFKVQTPARGQASPPTPNERPTKA